MRANLLVVVAAASLAGCASGAWTQVGDVGVDVAGLGRPRLPPHRGVEHVKLRVAGREFEFVGYRVCDPLRQDVRAQLLLESGLSVLDVAVHGDAGERISGSAFEAIPHLAEVVMGDLRHTWGSRSVFGAAGGTTEQAFNATFLQAPVVTDGRMENPVTALPLASGAFVASTSTKGGPLHVTILDEDLVPEATVDYSDFEDGVPREIHLVDLVHEHSLDIEVEEVHFPNKAP